MKQGDLFSDTDADAKPPKRPGTPKAPNSSDMTETPAPLPRKTPAREPAEPASPASPARERKAARAPLVLVRDGGTGGAGGTGGDAEQRRLSVTCFDRPILLAAGAGTGKTATLVARVVQWCLGEGWALEDDGSGPPDDVAVRVLRGVSAITFTEAAAAEMSTRVAQALARVQRVTANASEVPTDDLPLGLVPDALPDDPAQLFARARALRAALEQLNVSTIHAFCRRLLAAHPLQVGLDPAFQVDATFSQTEIVLREVLEEFLREAWSDPVDEDLIALARHGTGPPEIERAIVDLVDAGARAEDFEVDPLSDERCAELCAGFDAALERVLASVAPLGSVRGNTSLAVTAVCDSAAKRAASAGGAGGVGDVGGTPRERVTALCATLAELWADSRASARLEKWAKGELNKGETAAVGGGLESFVEACGALHTTLQPLLRLDVVLLESSRRVVSRILRRVQFELRRRGVATFGDLLTEARRLLVENEPIAARERGRIRQLLVDEFQDTDGVQCDIVRALGLGGAPETRPGLFLVGDPKQSIFAWRSADLEAFDAFADSIAEAGGLRLELTRNFRSRRSILDEVARSVSSVMEEERGLQPPFAPLEATREDPDDAHGPSVEFWASWPVDPDSGEIDPTAARRKGPSYDVEAQALAHDIAARRVAEDGAWSDFAVVFRALTMIEPYLEQLRVLGIPYEVQSDRKYYQRREVIDLAALVRSVIDPHDHLALVTLLRSPIVGVPDAALLPLWEQGLPGAVSRLFGPDEERLDKLRALVDAAAAKVPTSIPGLDAIRGWERSLVAALEALAEARRSFQSDPADTWIETLRTRFPAEATESARFLGSYRLANQERFFRDLLRAIEERGGDVQSIVRSLRANLAREDRSEVARPSDSGQDAVRILTVHGSKGLEFKHVYLAQTHKESGRPPQERPTAFDRHGDRVTYQLFGVAAPDWHETERRRELSEAAEHVRLMYVALTRAIDRLVVMGGFSPAPTPKPWRKARAMTDLLVHRPGAVEAAGELARRAARGDVAPWIDEWGTLWRLAAAGAGPRGTGSADATESEPVADPATIERESRELAEQRARSRRHEARPFHTTASSEAHGESNETRAAQHFAEGEDETVASRSVSSIGRAAAQAAGTAVHRVLERFDFTAGRAPELERWRAKLPELPELAAGRLGDDDADDAVQRASELLTLVDENGILERLAELAPHVVARELAVLLGVDPDVAGTDPSAPVGFVSGAIDLVYRDPKTKELVVVDFKTDVAEDDAALRELVTTYAAQGRRYVEALEDALALEHAPRFELWFLRPGRVAVVPTA